MSAPLKDWQVIILRQPTQAQPLVELIKSLQGMAIVCPTSKIIPLPILPDKLKELHHADYAIVASSQAPLTTSLEALQALKAQANLKMISMGKSTTQALQQQGFQVYFTPPPGTTSESLLDEAFLQSDQIRNKRIILWSGIEGRTELEQRLQQRHATIVWLQTYQQEKLLQNFDQAVSQWCQRSRTIFLAFSSKTLEFLCADLSPAHREWCFAQPLVVISERLVKQAQGIGFKSVYKALSALPEDIEPALHEIINI